MAAWKKLRRACNRATMRRAGLVALVVGTVLNLINHFDLMMGVPATSTTMLQMGLTYMVPFMVSTHAQIWWSDD